MAGDGVGQIRLCAEYLAEIAAAALGKEAPTELAARKTRLVEQCHAQALSGGPSGGGAACRTGANDDDVKLCHALPLGLLLSAFPPEARRIGWATK